MRAQFLTGWEATTFLVGEYDQDEIRDNPLFTIADGLFWLWQVTEGNSVGRKMQIMKLRGQASVPGLPTFPSVMTGARPSRGHSDWPSESLARNDDAASPPAFPSSTR